MGVGQQCLAGVRGAKSPDKNMFIHLNVKDSWPTSSENHVLMAAILFTAIPMYDDIFILKTIH